jgi:hypothetical protein
MNHFQLFVYCHRTPTELLTGVSSFLKSLSVFELVETNNVFESGVIRNLVRVVVNSTFFWKNESFGFIVFSLINTFNQNYI